VNLAVQCPIFNGAPCRQQIHVLESRVDLFSKRRNHSLEKIRRAFRRDKDDLPAHHTLLEVVSCSGVLRNAINARLSSPMA
jgi:hypothetical protein